MNGPWKRHIARGHEAAREVCHLVLELGLNRAWMQEGHACPSGIRRGLTIGARRVSHESVSRQLAEGPGL